MNWPPEYELVRTEDGSPSLAWTSPEGRTECMHSRAGALSESLFIYDEAYKVAQDRGWRWSVLSMGLGLGYNEMILAGRWLSRSERPPIRLESFENQAFLTQNIKSWLRGGSPSEFASLEGIYDEIAAQVARAFGVRDRDIRATLREWWECGQWLLREAMTPTTEFDARFTVFLYDAYSSKTHPELWSRDHLTRLLETSAESECVLATYAVTGELKRVLKSQGFALEPRSGFAGKRESTFAVRLSPARRT